MTTQAACGISPMTKASLHYRIVFYYTIRIEFSQGQEKTFRVPFDFLIDCQVMNEHLKFMGAKAMRRSEFLAKFNELKQQPSGFSEFKNLP